MLTTLMKSIYENLYVFASFYSISTCAFGWTDEKNVARIEELVNHLLRGYSLAECANKTKMKNV